MDPNDDGTAGPPKLKVMPRQLTMAGEAQRRGRKATVGEVEDGLRNLMRLVKGKVDALEALTRSQDAVIETLLGTIDELETALKETNPGWAGLTAALPDGTDPGAAIETAPPGGGYAIAPPVSDPTATPTEDPR